MLSRFTALFRWALVACLVLGALPASAFGFGGGGGGIFDPPSSSDGGDPDGVGLDDPEKGPDPPEILVVFPGPTGFSKTVRIVNTLFQTWSVMIWR